MKRKQVNNLVAKHMFQKGGSHIGKKHNVPRCKQKVHIRKEIIFSSDDKLKT